MRNPQRLRGANGYFAQARLIATRQQTWFETESTIQYMPRQPLGLARRTSWPKGSDATGQTAGT